MCCSNASPPASERTCSVSDILDMADEATLELVETTTRFAEAAAKAAHVIEEAFGVLAPIYWFPDPNDSLHREAIYWLREREFYTRYEIFMTRRRNKRKRRRP